MFPNGDRAGTHAREDPIVGPSPNIYDRYAMLSSLESAGVSLLTWHYVNIVDHLKTRRWSQLLLSRLHRAEQHRAEQHRAEEYSAEQHSAEQYSAEQHSAEEYSTEQHRAKEYRAKEYSTERHRAEEYSTGRQVESPVCHYKIGKYFWNPLSARATSHLERIDAHQYSMIRNNEEGKIDNSRKKIEIL